MKNLNQLFTLSSFYLRKTQGFTCNLDYRDFKSNFWNGKQTNFLMQDNFKIQISIFSLCPLHLLQKCKPGGGSVFPCPKEGSVCVIYYYKWSTTSFKTCSESSAWSYNTGVPNIQDLMPDDVRWSWCNNNRNKVHNKCKALESPWNHPPTLVHGKMVSYEPVPGAQNGWGPLL